MRGPQPGTGRRGGSQPAFYRRGGRNPGIGRRRHTSSGSQGAGRSKNPVSGDQYGTSGLSGGDRRTECADGAGETDRR